MGKREDINIERERDMDSECECVRITKWQAYKLRDIQ